MATLERLLARTREGRGQVVMLTGEPGVGKSARVGADAESRVDGWQMHEAGACRTACSRPTCGAQSS